MRLLNKFLPILKLAQIILSRLFFIGFRSMSGTLSIKCNARSYATRGCKVTHHDSPLWDCVFNFKWIYNSLGMI